MKMKKYRVMLLSATLMLASSVFAQQQKYSGTVLDANGDPVIGATVKVPGASTGVVTDLDGNFTISVNPGQKLEVSYIGYQSQTLTAKNNMQVTLQGDDKLLDEVIVVGYGVQKKSVVTAAIAKVSADDLNGKAPVRVENALKGLAAGVNVTSASGQPGSAPKVRIRGTGTINNSNPLYVVDGMPIEGGHRLR